MWEVLPIQRTTTIMDGQAWTMIDRDYPYPIFTDIEAKFWKDADEHIRAWCMSIWKDVFGVKRPCAGDNDILVWCPRKGMLLAKHGKWIGETKSFHGVYVCYNYVDKEFRGQGLSGRLILSMAHQSTKEWGPVPFFFELSRVPESIATVPSFLKFSYVWVPFVHVSVPPKWTPTDFNAPESYRGFHPYDLTGYRAFQYNGMKIIFDPHDDIVYYDDLSTLHTFDGMTLVGSYCRVFTPFGNTHVFLQNMYFDLPTSFTNYLLA